MDQQRALQRYEETWLAFTEELKSNPTVTLRAICKKLHTNECGMSKWASRHDYSAVAARLHCHKRQVRHHPHSFVSTTKFNLCNIRFPCLPESVLHSAVVQRYASSREMRTALSDLSTCTRERMVNHVFSNISQQVLSLSRVHPDES